MARWILNFFGKAAEKVRRLATRFTFRLRHNYSFFIFTENVNSKRVLTFPNKNGFLLVKK